VQTYCFTDGAEFLPELLVWSMPQAYFLVCGSVCW